MLRFTRRVVFRFGAALRVVRFVVDRFVVERFGVVRRFVVVRFVVLRFRVVFLAGLLRDLAAFTLEALTNFPFEFWYFPPAVR